MHNDNSKNSISDRIRSIEFLSKGLSITRERLRHYSEGSFLEIEEVLSEKGDVLGTRALLKIELLDDEKDL